MSTSTMTETTETLIPESALSEIKIWIKALKQEGVSADKAAEIAAHFMLPLMERAMDESYDGCEEEGDEDEE